MSDRDTTMGGVRDAFPETAWSAFLSTPGPGDRRSALQHLCTLYWRPVYRFIRTAGAKSIEESKDLAQAFFCRLLEDEDFLSRYRSAQGRFRHFLKGALRNFLHEAQRSGTRLKRGGGIVVPMDVAKLETGGGAPDAAAASPEEAFDRQMARDLMSRSYERLKAVLALEGKAEIYRVFEAYELSPTDPSKLSYDELGRRFGISHSQVSNHLVHARDRLRQIILEQVSDVVSSPAELEEELRDLFGL